MLPFLTTTPKPPIYRRFAVIGGFIALVNFLLFQPWGTGAVLILFITGWILITLFYGSKNNRLLSTPGFLYPSLTLGVTLWMLTRTATPFLQIWLSLISIGLLIFTAYFLASGETFIGRLGHIFLVPFKWLEGYLSGLGVTLSLSSSKALQEQYFPDNPRLTRQILPILTGVMIAIPVLAVLISLLSSADPIYGHYVKQWLGFLTDGNLLTRILISILLLLGLTPFVFALIPGFHPKDLAWLKHFVFPTQFSVVMTLVALTFASFLVVQAPYIFVSVPKETDLVLYGVNTYSEYVQKGFGELVTVAILLFGLIWLGLFSVRANTAASRFLKGVQLIALLEFLIFLASVFRRVALYITYHGWSLNRWYGTILLLWLAGLGITLIGRHLAAKRWMYWDLGITVVFLLVVGFFKPEPFITTHNPPTVNKRIDYLYLSRMSADGYVGWQKSFDHINQVLYTPAWPQKPILEREDRREIAYAGMVLAELWAHRLDLLHQYGSDKETASFYTQVLDAEITRLNGENNLTLQDSRYNQVQKDQRLAANQPLLTTALQLREDLRTGKAHRGDIHKRVQFMKYAHVSFETQNQPLSYFMITPNSSADFQSIPYPLSPWDRILLWNGVTSRIASRIQTDLPAEKLLQLTQRYFELNQRIRNQPSNQRDFEWDSQPYSIFLNAGSGN